MKKSFSSLKDYFKKPKDNKNDESQKSASGNLERLIETVVDETISSSIKEMKIADESHVSKVYDETDPGLSNNVFDVTKKVKLVVLK
jgi:hypothetical protein